jgi:hypothetical protein
VKRGGGNDIEKAISGEEHGVLTFPPEVIKRVAAYTKDYSVEPATLIPLAIKAQENQSEKFSEAGERLMEDSDSFTWPLEDPLLCVALAFMLKHACRCAEKVHENRTSATISRMRRPTGGKRRCRPDKASASF